MFNRLSFLILGGLLSLVNNGPSSSAFSGVVYLKSTKAPTIYKCEGFANRSHKVAISKETVFDIASLNKSFMANLVLQAVAEGRWQPYSKLNDLLKEYGFSARFEEDINLHQMLCHRSGLADYDDLPAELRANNFRQFKRSSFSNEEYLSFLAQQKHAKPDQQFRYSNFAYHILAILLEAEYQQTFESTLRNKIGVKLNMCHLYAPQDRGRIIPNLALGYTKEGEAYVENNYIDLSLGRRIFCSASDLMLWLESGGGRTLLPDSLANLVMQNHLHDLGDQYSYGYGWVPFKAHDQYQMGNLDLAVEYFIHGGSTEGYQSLAVSVNEGETNLVLLANDGDGKALFEKAKTILNEIYGED